MKIKFNLDDDYSREDILEFLRNKFNIQEQINSYYSLPELLAINAMGQNILGPLAAQIRNGKLRRVTLNQIAQLRD